MLRKLITSTVVGFMVIAGGIACASGAVTPTGSDSAPSNKVPILPLTRSETATLKILNEAQPGQMQCIATTLGSNSLYDFITLASRTLAPTFDPSKSELASMAPVSVLKDWADCGVDFDAAFGMSKEKLEGLLTDEPSPAANTEISDPAPTKQASSAMPMEAEEPEYIAGDDGTPDYNDDC